MATRLTSPSGPTVSVDDAKVEGLLRRGFARVEEEPKKSTTKKPSSRNTSTSKK